MIITNDNNCTFFCRALKAAQAKLKQAATAQQQEVCIILTKYLITNNENKLIIDILLVVHIN